jgi:hypothetical protein
MSARRICLRNQWKSRFAARFNRRRGAKFPHFWQWMELP